MSGVRRIDLDVPALGSSLRVLRLVAADAVSKEGASVVHVERASLAVDELAAILMSEGNGSRLTLTLSHSDEGVDVEGRIAADHPLPAVDPVAAELLQMWVGSGRWSLSAVSGQLCFRAHLLTAAGRPTEEVG